MSELLVSVAGSGRELGAYRSGSDVLLTSHGALTPVLRAPLSEFADLLSKAIDLTLNDAPKLVVVGQLGEVHVAAIPGRFVRISDHPNTSAHSGTLLRLDNAERLRDALVAANAPEPKAQPKRPKRRPKPRTAAS